MYHSDSSGIKLIRDIFSGICLFFFKTGIAKDTKFPFLKRILFIPLFLITLRAAAPSYIVVYINDADPIKPFDRIIHAVLMVESSGDTLAFNLSEEAVGGLQIRPIRVLDYNQRTGKNIKVEDCYNFGVSKEIFIYYARLYGYRDYESIARNWNGSGKATLDYWGKIKSYL